MSNLVLVCHPDTETNMTVLWKLGVVEADEVKTNNHLKPGSAFVIDMDWVEQSYQRAYEEMRPTFMAAYFARVWGDG